MNKNKKEGKKKLSENTDKIFSTTMEKMFRHDFGNYNGFNSPEFMSVVESWLESFKFPSLGPITSYYEEYQKDITKYFDLYKYFTLFQNSLSEYWSLINSTYMEALKEIATKIKIENVNSFPFLDENERTIIISILDSHFITLFTSEKFAIVSRNMLNSQMDIIRILHLFNEKTLKLLNLPTREENDDILKELVILKRQMADLEKKMERLENRK